MAGAGEDVRGKFIVLEGLDGSDTFAQAVNLVQWLNRDKGLRQVHLTREPSEGPVGLNIRMALEKRLDVDALSVATFFAADRMDHLYRRETGVLARLRRGEYVVCDRYYLSSYAYQTLQPGVDLEWLQHLNAKCKAPDLTIFIDVPVKQCLDRIVSEPLRGIHFAMFDPSKEKIDQVSSELEEVRNKYLEAIRSLRDKGERIEIVAKDTPETIEREVRRVVTRSFQM